MKTLLLNISWFKTIWFNFHYFKIREAIVFPVFVSKNTKFNSLKGRIILKGVVKTGRIRIGFGSVPIFDKRKSRTIWNFGNGLMVFNGKCSIGHGSKIGCGGTIIFGDNFQITAETIIICNHRIEFGKDVLISWLCQIMDSDFHKIIINNEQVNFDLPIIIGNHVWIGSHVLINKGTILPDNSIVASGSIVTKEFKERNIIIAGIPAKVVKNNVNWAY